jgi:uncharacterized protein (TIGR02996 family)
MAIVENPDDLASIMALADYLGEQEDPYGDFLKVQLALDDANESEQRRSELRKSSDEMFAKHGAKWFGDLGRYLLRQSALGTEQETLIDYQLRRGTLYSIHLRNVTLEFMRILSSSPRTRMLQRLILESFAYDDDSEQDEGITLNEVDHEGLYPLTRSVTLGNLREFQFGYKPSEEEEEKAQWGFIYSGFTNALMGDVLRRMPSLRSLRIYAHNHDSFGIFSLPTFTHLEELIAYHQNDYPLHTLARNPCLQKLQSLAIHPHSLEHEQAYVRLDGIRELVRSPYLQSLTHLKIRMTDAGDKGIKEIIDSGILRRLKVLDLRHGCITDQGAKMLAACEDARQLELLDLKNNNISQDGIRALVSLHIPMMTNDQWTQDEQTHGQDYLRVGDYE